MPHRRQGSLARRAAQVLLAFALLPALLLGLALSAWYEHVDQQHAAAMLSDMADGAELALRSYLARHRDAVAVLAADPVLRGQFDTATLQPRLRLLRYMYPGFLTAFAAAPDGRVLTAEPALDASGKPDYWRGVSVGDREYFRQALRGGRAYVSGIFQSRGYEQGMLIAVAAPVYAADGRLQGVIGAVLDPGQLQADLGRLAGPSDTLALIDPAGRIVAASPSLGVRRGQPAPASPLLRGILAMAPDHAGDVGPAWWWTQRGLRETLPDGWQVLTLGPRQFFAHAWLPSLGLLVLLLVPVTLLVRLALPRATRRLMRPVRVLADELARFDPGGGAELPASLRQVPYELRPIVDALEAHAALIQALLAQREDVLAEREHEIEQRTRELRRAVAALNETARTDGLTGLTNYRGWREQAENLWHEAQESGREIAALTCDIDHFKAYNDHYGHPAGDACLRRVAGALRQVLDRHARVLARSGGEEFIALLLPAQRRRVEALAESVRSAVAVMALEHAASPHGQVTLSLGFSVMLATPEARLDVLLRAADLALYRAKRNGRNQVCELSVSALQKLRVEE